MARIIIGCETSGVVREAFRRRGHDAWSCDLLPADDGSPFHYQQDLRTLNMGGWDLGIFHPTCQYLCSSGLHWNKRVPGRDKKTEEAIEFVKWLWDLPIPKIAIENPVGCLSTRWRKPDCRVQPFEHGHPESKATCLWLKGLPNLVPTKVLPTPPGGRWENQTASGQNKLAPSADRWKIRSRTYEGIGAAFAEQWG